MMRREVNERSDSKSKSMRHDSPRLCRRIEQENALNQAYIYIMRQAYFHGIRTGKSAEKYRVTKLNDYCDNRLNWFHIVSLYRWINQDICISTRLEGANWRKEIVRLTYVIDYNLWWSQENRVEGMRTLVWL